ncbi:complement resistance protein TraT [Rheinheimera baltica]|uniref:complement resistance protein TraT n=1 Tax=Rheinheimera baltica TaxID=67576 RepID=UPI00273EA734|nr:complement resistance protein TraT [Rheinheimera baltica]MDP5188822.1 complement resistance protein TraT [Rheinheimera baltica]
MRLVVLIATVWALSGCTALHTSVAKHKLDAQTRMSETVYLDPVEPELRTIFLDIRNTTAEYQLPLADDVRHFMLERGYLLVDSPMRAQYWLQVNVRTVLKERPDIVLAQEYGMTADETHALLHPGMAPPPESETPEQRSERYGRNTAVFVDTSIGANLDGKDIARALVVLAVFAGAEYIGNQLVKDKYYTMLTDVQIAERISPDSEQKVQEYAEHQLLQGDSGAFEQLWQRDTEMRKYQLKVVSFANKANLKWKDAEQPLHQGLLRSLAGIF